MDFSLLLVLEDHDASKETNAASINNCDVLIEDTRNNIGKQHIGIIDYLQLFNFNKKAEACWKTRVLGNKADLLSVAPPEIYQRRFMKYMREYVFSDGREDYNNML